MTDINAGLIKEYQILSELSKYFDIYDEEKITRYYHTTKIDCIIHDNKIPKVAIQIKHGNAVNNTDAVIAFNASVNELNEKIIKIWYSEFSLTKGCLELIRKYNILYFDNINSLLTYLKDRVPQKITNPIIHRTYQINAINYAFDKLKQNESTMLCMPPGVGKTTIALEIAYKFYPAKILWITRRKDIIDSQFHDIKYYKDMPCINALTRLGKIGYRIKTENGLYVINEAQILNLGIDDCFDLIIFDEAHDTGAPRIFDILSKNQKPKLGLSATPYTNTAQHINNVKNLFPNQYSIDIIEAIEAGYILPITFWFRSDVYSAIDDAIRILPWFKSIVWTETIEESKLTYSILQDRYKKYNICRSDSECDRDCSIINRFLQEDSGIIVCAKRAREGWNDPKVNCGVYIYPIQDRAINVGIQSSSRMNRIYPGKDKAIVIDCVERDPVQFITDYYLGYSGQRNFHFIEFAKTSDDVLQIMMKNKLIGSIKLNKDFSFDLEPDQIKAVIHKKLFGTMSYRSLCEKFQAFIKDQKVDPNFENYKKLIIGTDFPPNPVCDFPNLKWYEVFGVNQTDIICFKDLKKICRTYYKLQDATRLKQLGVKKFEMLYNEVKSEYGSKIPPEPGDVYKEFKNKRFLFIDTYE
jgi:DNA polymerase III delta prime subunit